jgi:alcohol dehydrogenase class IV
MGVVGAIGTSAGTVEQDIQVAEAAVAVLLPTVTRFSIPGATRRYAQLARSMDLAGDKNSDEVAAKKLVEGLEDLNQDLNIPRLGALKENTSERLQSASSTM